MNKDIKEVRACLSLWEERIDKVNEEIAQLVRLPLEMRNWYETRVKVCQKEIQKLKKRKSE